ncbi:MAG TPA: hypothetical protein VGL10_03610 [Gammaproteobacteria bacterium]
MKIGDNLYLPASRSNNEIWVTITSIGRSWIYIDKKWHGRIHKQTLRGELGSQWYTDKSVWEEEQRVRKLYDKLQSYFRNRFTKPDNLTAEQIEAAIRAIGLSEVEPPASEG